MKKRLSDQEWEKLLPSLIAITDPSLKSKIIEAWNIAFIESNWESIQDVWIDPDNSTGERLLPHVNRVAALCIAAYDTLKEYNTEILDKQSLLALALMHDVCKVLEFEPDEKKGCRFSSVGLEFQHGVVGVLLASRVGIDQKLMHLIHTHTTRSGMEPRYPEGILFRHLDLSDFELISRKVVESEG